MSKALATQSAVLAPSTLFRSAADWWLESRNFQGSKRSRYVSPRTLRDYAQYIRALNRFFAEIPLNEIHLGHLAVYQKMRSRGDLGPRPEEPKPDGWKDTKREVGSNKINQELGALVQIMQRANCWTTELNELYEPLQYEDSDIPRALSPPEQELWLEASRSRRDWEIVHYYSVLAFQTTAREQEMRFTRIGDLNLFQAMLYIRRSAAKTKGSIREIPLTQEAVFAAKWLLERARSLRATDPPHYLFPFRVCRNDFDPMRPMTESGIKRQWNEVRLATGLHGFRQYDTRHTGCTRMAEAGVAIAVIQSFTGHLTEKMTRHYTRISEQAKRMAIEAAFAKKPARTFPHSYAIAVSR